MRSGIAFPHRHAHEAAHLRPLMDRLHDVMASRQGDARVVVLAESRAPVRGAWNVQVFHGLGDKGYTCNPLFLQRGRFPRLRTAVNLPLSRLRLPAPFLRPPRHAGRRRSRYQQVNAYGPRWADLFSDLLRDVEVSRFGHVALNDAGGLHADPDGPLVWLPTWDNRAYMGGADQSSLETFAQRVIAVAADTPVLVKLHPLTVRHGQAKAVRRRLAATPNVTMAPPEASAHRLLEGCRGVLTDTSSLGFEAYCSGLPVGIARNPGVHFEGLHAELAERTPVFAPGGEGLAEWARSPAPAADTAWARDLLYAPEPRRNDAFAAQLRERARRA
ncbi:MAG TPA: hypothetical protein VM286_06840 [Candidatus Thermoplasmatota archaeon]|nr:hypothetical protein [Candidatus Thermoplasmatota archaeon]